MPDYASPACWIGRIPIAQAYHTRLGFCRHGLVGNNYGLLQLATHDN